MDAPFLAALLRSRCMATTIFHYATPHSKLYVKFGTERNIRTFGALWYPIIRRIVAPIADFGGACKIYVPIATTSPRAASRYAPKLTMYSNYSSAQRRRSHWGRSPHDSGRAHR